MNRINRDIIRACNEVTCLRNELVILPQNGNVGFEEYVQHKAREIAKVKNLSPYIENQLILTYPTPESREYLIFERFFESPSVVAYNHVFEGCFAIDVTAYINKQNNDNFLKLISYMLTNVDTVFTLFIYTNNKNEVQKMFDCLSQYMDINLVEIPLPGPQALADYTVDKIREFSLHVSSSVTEYLSQYYETKQFGYDDADYFVRYLRQAGYSGDLRTIKKLVQELSNKDSRHMPSTGLGY